MIIRIYTKCFVIQNVSKSLDTDEANFTPLNKLITLSVTKKKVIAKHFVIRQTILHANKHSIQRKT